MNDKCFYNGFWINTAIYDPLTGNGIGRVKAPYETFTRDGRRILVGIDSVEKELDGRFGAVKVVVHERSIEIGCFIEEEKISDKKYSEMKEVFASELRKRKTPESVIDKILNIVFDKPYY